MKKKILKIAALCLALILIGGVLVFANALVGNPLSAALAKSTAKNILKTEYADTDYRIERISFNFKDTNYYAYITSDSNMDGDFTLNINMLGVLIYNDYDYRVTQKSNLLHRLSEEYREAVRRVFESTSFPYENDDFGELRIGTYPIDEPLPDNAVKSDELEINKGYNVGEIGRTNGYISLFVEVDTVTAEQAARVLLTTKRMLEEKGIYFYAIDLTVRYPRIGDTYDRPEGNIRIKNFLCSDIYEEGLVQRIERADSALKAYYDRMDQEKESLSD